jgi:hypothetical protein
MPNPLVILYRRKSSRNIGLNDECLSRASCFQDAKKGLHVLCLVSLRHSFVHCLELLETIQINLPFEIFDGG